MTTAETDTSRAVESREDFLTVDEAAKILGLGVSHSRALLGEPDNIQLSAVGQVQYTYRMSRVVELARKREDKRKKRAETLGKRSCYFCREKFEAEELSGGFCPDCHARKLVRNFLCYGDACRNGFNYDRLKYLVRAIDYFRSQKDSQ